jgi:hypothetical protein
MVPAPRHWENIIQVNIQIPDKRLMVLCYAGDLAAPAYLL